MKEYGKLISMTYLGYDGEDEDPAVRIFKVVCKKSTHTLGLSIDEMQRLHTFRFHTTSPAIDKMLKEAK